MTNHQSLSIVVNPMTMLSNNIKSLRKKYKLTQDQLGAHCGVSGQAVSQWEAINDPTAPETEHILTMASLFKVTVEQLVYSKGIDSCMVMSPDLNATIVEKVFTLLYKNNKIDKAFFKASIKRKTYMFGLLYSLCEEMDDDEIADATGLIEMIGLSSGEENKNEPTKKKSAAVTKKQRKRR